MILSGQAARFVGKTKRLSPMSVAAVCRVVAVGVE